MVGVGLGVVGFGVGFGAGGGGFGEEGFSDGFGTTGFVEGVGFDDECVAFGDGFADVADGFTFFEGVGLGLTVLVGEGTTVGRTVTGVAVGLFTALGFVLGGPTKNAEALPIRRPTIAIPAKSLLRVG